MAIQPHLKTMEAKMLIERFIRTLPVKSNFTKLITGAAFSALAISIGFIGVSSVLALPINTEMAVVFGAIGAAVYGIRCYQKR
jgi:phosphate/sulfate permease